MTEWAWHVHHNILAERLTEPLEVRCEYIRQCKPPAEQTLRLRLLKPVRNTAVLEAYEAVQRPAWEAYKAAERPAWEAYKAAERPALEAYKAVQRPALEAYEAAERLAREAVEILHREECPDCPWDGATIFPAPQRQDA